MAEGEIVALESSFSFLGGVDQSSGLLQGSGSVGIAGKVFAFTEGKGSTVGSYTMLEMKRRGTLPVAILNTIAEPIVTTGAVICRIPLVDSIDVSVLRNGDRAIVDGTRGAVEIEGVELKDVVTCILTNGDRFLIMKRSEKVGTFKGKWAGVSGFVEVGEEPIQTAVKEMSEEVNVTDARLLKKAAAILVRSGDIVWKLHPFLFAIDNVRVEIDWEHTEHRWILAENLREFDTVPGLDKVIRALLSA
jgi:predicted aconitase with swiveling domain/8-oxo-dGTP pyrophosphatase MutT (NUDIX family)